MLRLMKKYLIEFIGTFFFFFTIANVVIDPGAGALAPVAIGIALMVMVYMGGHISGAHYNPAVTLAVALRGKCPKNDIAGYLLAQLAGAGLAAVTVTYLKGGGAATPMTLEIGPSILVEFLGTFILAFVVLNVATAKTTEGNPFYGFAIGGVLMAMVFAVGGISGGAFNPAVTTGLIISGVIQGQDIWIHLLGQALAAVAAAQVFKFTTGE